MSILGLSLGIMTLIGVIFANTTIGNLQSGFVFCGVALSGLLLASADPKLKGLKIAAQVVCIVSIGLNGFVGYTFYSNNKAVEEELKQQQLAYENAMKERDEQLRLMDEAKQMEERTNQPVNIDAQTTELNKYSEMQEMLNNDLSSINLYFDYDISTGTYSGKAYKYVKHERPEYDTLCCYDAMSDEPRVYTRFSANKGGYVNTKKALFEQNPDYATNFSGETVVPFIITIYDGTDNPEWLLDINENGMVALVNYFEDLEADAIATEKRLADPNREMGIQEQAVTGKTDGALVEESIERTSELMEQGAFVTGKYFSINFGR